MDKAGGEGCLKLPSWSVADPGVRLGGSMQLPTAYSTALFKPGSLAHHTGFFPLCPGFLPISIPLFSTLKFQLHYFRLTEHSRFLMKPPRSRLYLINFLVNTFSFRIQIKGHLIQRSLPLYFLFCLLAKPITLSFIILKILVYTLFYTSPTKPVDF